MKLDERKEQRRMYNFECNFESSFTELTMVFYVVHICNIVWKKEEYADLLSEYWNINRREMNLTFAWILQYIANLNYQVNTTSFLRKYGDSYGTNWTVELLKKKKKTIKAEEQ